MLRSRRAWWGIVLILLGVLFLLDNMRVLDFNDVVYRYWPALLVLWGIMVLVRRREGRDRIHDAAPVTGAGVFGDSRVESNEERIQHSNVFGDLDLHIKSQSFKGGFVSTVFGDTELDLSGGMLADGEQELKLSGVFGDATVTVPRDSAFALHAHAVFGDVRAKDQRRTGIGSTLIYETPGYAAAQKKLKIQASQVFGDITVRD